MECSTYALAFNAGMAATITLFNTLKQGDSILCVDDVYGGTQRYMRKILGPNTSVTVEFVDFNHFTEFKKALKPSVKIVWLESPTNPTLKCYDIKKIADYVHAHSKALFVVDNTFFTAVNQQPMLLGADIVMHSVSKYIGGHSDVIAGALCMNSRQLYDDLFFIMKTMGTGLPAFESWLALRGSKTMYVRVKQSNASAMVIAKMLEAHPKVEKVVYPGLKSHPQHGIVKKNASGFGGMISFYVKGNIKMADRFLRALKVVTLAESLGGVESLIEHPALMTHGSVPAEHRAMLGIADNFIRMSVGIETQEDLVADMK